MRASSKAKANEEEDSKNRKHKKDRKDSNKREHEDKGESKRYLNLIRVFYSDLTIISISFSAVALDGHENGYRAQEAGV